MLLLIRTLFIDRFVNWIISMEHCLVAIHSHPVVIVSDYAPLSDLLAVTKIKLDIESNENNHQTIKTGCRCSVSQN